MFVTVYDISEASFTQWGSILFGLVFVAAGLVLVAAPGLVRRVLPGGLQGPARVVFSVIFLLFGLVFSYAQYDSTYPAYRHLKDEFLAGHYEVVEGPVEKFHAMPYGGHDSERFEVSGVKFGFSDYNYTGGYNTTVSHGGVIREGEFVRISHVDHLIAKLEVRR